MLEQVRFNYSKLNNRVDKLYGSQARFIELSGYNSNKWVAVMNGVAFFDQIEIKKISCLLAIKNEEICLYFFDSKIKKT